MAKKKDFGFDSLLALNGDRYFIDNKGEFEAINTLETKFFLMNSKMHSDYSKIFGMR